MHWLRRLLLLLHSQLRFSWEEAAKCPDLFLLLDYSSARLQEHAICCLAIPTHIIYTYCAQWVQMSFKDESDYLAFKETTWFYSEFVYHSTYLCEPVLLRSQPIQICCTTITKGSFNSCTYISWDCLNS